MAKPLTLRVHASPADPSPSHSPPGTPRRWCHSPIWRDTAVGRSSASRSRISGMPDPGAVPHRRSYLSRSPGPLWSWSWGSNLCHGPTARIQLPRSDSPICNLVHRQRRVSLSKVTKAWAWAATGKRGYSQDSWQWQWQLVVGSW